MFKKKRAIRKVNSGCFKQKTHCSRGHEFTKDNTRITKQNYKLCIICDSYRQKKYRQKRKGLGVT